jgi:maltose O-acetyltransferase
VGEQKDRMLAGEQYKAEDPDLRADYERCEQALVRFNATTDRGVHAAILKELLAEVGEDVSVRPPFRLEYGYQTRIGPRSFVNFGAVFLDVGRITIGADVQMGPNVQLLTATHPIEPDPRRDRWEGSEPITIGDNVWFGGGVIVCPGVTIGENTVVGAGSVVPRDLPANVVAVGNPARIVKHI